MIHGLPPPVVNFEVPGEPVGKGRPRFARTARGVRTYTPARTAAYESRVAAAAAAAMAGRPPVDAPVAVLIEARLRVPPSWPKKRAQEALAGKLGHRYRPDIDNVTKAVLDGLAGICVAEDCLVAAILAEKRYDADPGTSVSVYLWQSDNEE